MTLGMEHLFTGVQLVSSGPLIFERESITIVRVLSRTPFNATWITLRDNGTGKVERYESCLRAVFDESIEPHGPWTMGSVRALIESGFDGRVVNE